MAISILNNFRQLSLICPMLKSHKLSENIYRKLLFRGLSTYKETFKFIELEITPIESIKKKPKPDPNTLVFGKEFCDHMLEIEWDAIAGWGKPHICRMHDLILHPASKVFHYAQEVFEGMKAYRGLTGKVSLFRPMLNIQRMLTTSERAALPLFDGQEFLKCLKKLVSIDQEWVPNSDSSSLYIRPTYIGIEPSLGVAASKKALLYVICGPVGPYFSGGVRDPVSLFASPQYVRAWPGGIGDKKMGANYAPTVYIQQQAASKNLQQVLWLYGSDHQITEVGTMNVFVFLVNKNNEKELITPPLNGIILPGITRHSVLEVVRKWNEFKVSERIVTMEEVISAVNEDRLLEMFGVGTACVVCPIQSISYLGKVIKVPASSNKDLNQRIFDTLTGIQYGKIPSTWMETVD